MFTGIIQAVGEVAAIEQTGGDVKLRIKTGDLPLEDVHLGDSIATNGVCLTVTELPGDGYWADVSTETLSLTSLKSTVVGSAVNLEKSLTPTTALGGHLVSGHVDGVGRVVGLTRDARFELNIIPQTWEETVFSGYALGTEVNLEVDVIARYLERLLQSGVAPTASSITVETLKNAGYHSD
jgi:riboflavin synthase